MDDGDNSFNFAFPYLREGTGVDPQEDPWAFSRLLSSHTPSEPKLNYIPTPPQRSAPPTSLMQGNGLNEDNPEDRDVKPQISSAESDSQETLSKEEKKVLKQRIEDVRSEVSKGPLVVQSFGTGKQKSDAKTVDVVQALEEEGYGTKKKRKTSSTQSGNCFKFE